MPLKPDGKMAPALFLVLITTMSVGCVGCMLVGAVRGLLPLDAGLFASRLFAFFIGVMVVTFRHHKSLVLTDQGISFLSPARGPARFFLRMERTFIDWRDVRKLKLWSIQLILQCDAKREGINLLWFKDPSKVIGFVSSRTNLIPEKSGVMLRE